MSRLSCYLRHLASAFTPNKGAGNIFKPIRHSAPTEVIFTLGNRRISAVVHEFGYYGKTLRAMIVPPLVKNDYLRLIGFHPVNNRRVVSNISFDEAKILISHLSAQGFKGIRMPTLDEGRQLLQSLPDLSCLGGLLWFWADDQDGTLVIKHTVEADDAARLQTTSQRLFRGAGIGLILVQEKPLILETR